MVITKQPLEGLPEEQREVVVQYSLLPRKIRRTLLSGWKRTELRCFG